METTHQTETKYFPPLWTDAMLDQSIQQALREDLEGGDLTAWSTIPSKQNALAQGIAKQDLVICGLPIAEKVFAHLDKNTSFKTHVKEGDFVKKGTLLFEVEGEIHALLGAERLALNYLQHLSGIASTANRYKQAVQGLDVRIVDTRKTLPGLRAYQRYAVRVGGCHNHRYNLAAGVLIKENHIRIAGSITTAISRAKQFAPHTTKIEIEVTNLQEFEEAQKAGADIIMLDNMGPEELTQAVSTKKEHVLLEASGGITLETIRAVAETGVDIISVGALTHSIIASDISLLIKT